MALKPKTPAAAPVEEKPVDQVAQAPEPTEPAPAPAEPAPAPEQAKEPEKEPEQEPEQPASDRPKTIAEIVKELEASHGEFVFVTNDRKTAFRQASTDLWIQGGERKQLMNDGWLRNQVAARLFSAE